MGRSGRRAKVGFTDDAIAQINKLSEPEIHALDRALAALSVDLTMGKAIPGSDPGLWRYNDEIEDVTVIYYVTARRTDRLAAIVAAED
ncbi:hypothetical protein [Streptomyces sp. 769]|uniref:hypothetical protein n=1 Tax=Streptomyces sp. 769 TaxID=1262452 RepID=UPI000581F6D6|nr:hypothetical protein [Streptomyces sp. 769]AJC62059.1 hypothetical protein GZL_p00129 [Streptomyces sp. 769]